MTVIDLGELTADPLPEPEEETDHLRARPIAAVLAMLAALVCAGSARPAEPGVRTLWSVELASESNVLVSGDMAYAVRGSEQTDVIAYTLADGVRRWSRELSGSLAGFRAAPGGGPLLLSVEPMFDPDSTGHESAVSRTTIALRAGTGEELWRRPGEVHPLAIDGESTLLIRYDGSGGVLGLSRVRLTDGAPHWTRQVGSVQEVAVETGGGQPTRLVTNSRAGDLTVLRYTDAAVLAERRIPSMVTEPAVGRYVTLQAESGRLLALHSDGERSYSAAYDLETLREIPRIGSAAEVSYGCGVIICGHAADTLVALDPKTGRELWRYPGVAGISMIGEDRMVLDVRAGAEHALVDSRTGRRLAEALRGSVAPDFTRDDAILLLDRTVEPAGSISVARLDLRTGERTLLGALVTVPDQQRCQWAGSYLVCEGPGRLAVAAVPR